MQTILKSSRAKIRATFTGPDGEATVPTTPTVTITRNSDGVEVVTAEAATDEGSGVVFYTLDPADIPTVDLLRASWAAADASAADTEISVVGGFLCPLESIVGASAASKRALREAVERRLEDACNVAFRPSYFRETLVGDGTTELLPSRRRLSAILAATLDDVDVLADLTIGSGGTVIREGGFSTGAELNIAYVHGWPTTPGPITRAAIKLATVLSEGGDDRVERFREDDQEFWLSVAGSGRDTGIPEVDRAIADYRYPAYL